MTSFSESLIKGGSELTRPNICIKQRCREELWERKPNCSSSACSAAQARSSRDTSSKSAKKNSGKHGSRHSKSAKAKASLKPGQSAIPLSIPFVDAEFAISCPLPLSTTCHFLLTLLVLVTSLIAEKFSRRKSTPSSSRTWLSTSRVSLFCC